MKVELYLSDYATKTDLKLATGINTSDFAKKTDLADLNSDVDKLNMDKFKNVPNRLGSLNKKTQYENRALTRKLQLGPSGPIWESKPSEHACISISKCNWEVWGVL